MLKKIKKILEAVLGEKSPIVNDPNLATIKWELLKARKDSQIFNGHPAVRFLVTKSGHYYIANANEWIHQQMERAVGEQGNTSIAGELYIDGYLWFYKYSLFDYLGNEDPDRIFVSHEELIELFKKTKFYEIIKPLVKNIEVES